jgi:glutamate-5-semialdehyde dehydrogenase
MIAQQDILQQLDRVRSASRKAYRLGDEQIRKILKEVAASAEKRTDFILEENQKDLNRMDPDDPKYDRLKLTDERIKSIAEDMRNVANLPSPLGKVLEEKTLDNGLQMQKVSVPLGVIGIIYEARPNVTFDVFALCLKSGNACVLKGGSDAEFSNIAIVSIIHEVLRKHDVDEQMLYLMPASREATQVLLEAVGYVDIIIPRGSQGLINFVREHARVPVIETGAGIVHTYVDASADLKKAKDIVFNAKTRRVSVCNALDCLVIHQKHLDKLPDICMPLAEKQVEIFADEDSHAALEGFYPVALLQPALPEHFGTEFLSHKLSIKTVGSLQEALDHIAEYSSKHSEAIVAEVADVIREFMQSVDAAAVYANTSTAFTDGAQFGMGAEIGISTQKLHARGPMALPELTSYKWQIFGNGQVRG